MAVAFGKRRAGGPYHSGLARSVLVAVVALLTIGTAACRSSGHSQAHGKTASSAASPTTVKSVQMQWSAPQKIGTVQGYAGVSCPTANFCAALIADARTVGSAIIWNGTSWSAPQVLLNQNLNHVSCPSPSFCLAAAPNGTAFIWNGTSWSSGSRVRWPNPTDGLTNVSCASATFCAAPDVDGDVRVWNGSSWSVENKVGSDSISCPTASFCMVVDEQGNAAAWNGTSFSAPQRIDANSFAAVSCPSASFCMALDQQGDWLAWNGTSWSTPRPTQPARPNSAPSHGAGPNVVNWLSCPSASFCVAVGSDGSAIGWNGTSWSAPQSVDPSLANQGRPQLGIDAVSCPSTSLCVAVFPDGNAVIGRQAG